MPEPRENESRKDFISRCMSHEESIEMFPDEEQRLAVCHSIFDDKLKESAMAQGISMEQLIISIPVTLESAEAVLEADTGKAIIRITGIAFHEGVNKNGWAITQEGAELISEQMLDLDLTLNHPSVENGRFTRNMTGGTDEAVVGVVTEAAVDETGDGSWVVRFRADVHRAELFEALESGLWLREDYGVSIGGTGIPDKIIENADGSVETWFGKNFDIDHLAIVFMPAYPEAHIHTVERVEVELSATFNNDSDNALINREANIMTEEITEEIIEEEPQPDFEAEIASLREQINTKDDEIEAFKAAEDAKAEAERLSFVEQANEIGLKGHEELSSEVIANLIQSWQIAQPQAEMKPVESGYVSEVVTIPESSVPVVANWLNRQLVETPEPLYARCYNSWVKAWNGTLSQGENAFRAKTYEELKEMN